MPNQEAKLRRRIRDVARRYRSLGYNVIVNPSTNDLPEFLHGLKPDIVAQKADDRVVIEVKVQPELRGSNEIVSLAERITTEPAWRFELVVTSPATSGTSLASSEIATLIAKLLNEAGLLFKSGLRDAAVVYAFSTIEALVRDLARKHGTAANEDSFSKLRRKLVVSGVIDHDMFHELEKFEDNRNRIIHQIHPNVQISEQDIVKIVEKIKATLSDTNIAA